MTEDVVTPAPVRAVVVRWWCPFCGRSHSDRPRTRAHMARCWLNPANRSCKTCTFFEFDYDEPDVGYRGLGETCRKGLDPQVPSENRPDRMVFPLHCSGWELTPESEAS